VAPLEQTTFTTVILRVLRLRLFLGLWISCSVASMKASKPGNIFSISVMVVSLWVFWCCLFGRGSVSWIRGSSFLIDVRTLVWLRLTRYPSSVEEVYSL